MLEELIRELLASDALIALLAAWVLAIIPGPFRRIAQWLIDWLRQRALRELETRARTRQQRLEEAATVVVEYVEQTLHDAEPKSKQMAALTALNELAPNLDRREAVAYVEHAVYRLNEQQKRDRRLDELEAKLSQ